MDLLIRLFLSSTDKISEVGVPRPPRVRDDVPDVVAARAEQDDAFEAEAKACMLVCPVLSQRDIPVKVFRVEVHLLDPTLEHIESGSRA